MILECVTDIGQKVRAQLDWVTSWKCIARQDPSGIIVKFRDLGKTILLVEQNAFKALAVADRAYVLEQGRIVKCGPAKEIASDSAVKAAYLGSKSSRAG